MVFSDYGESLLRESVLADLAPSLLCHRNADYSCSGRDFIDELVERQVRSIWTSKKSGQPMGGVCPLFHCRILRDSFISGIGCFVKECEYGKND